MGGEVKCSQREEQSYEAKSFHAVGFDSEQRHCALGRLTNSPEGRVKLLITALSDITDGSLLDELTGDSWKNSPSLAGPGRVSC